MSAVEALAEDLWMQHQEYFQTDSPWYDPERGILRILQGIRSMPAELKAEVIDGEVERRFLVVWDDGNQDWFLTRRAAWKFIKAVNANGGCQVIEQTRFRVVTPWLPLGVSPETNGEQK